MSISGLGVAVKCAAGCMYYRVHWASPFGESIRQFFHLSFAAVVLINDG